MCLRVKNSIFSYKNRSKKMRQLLHVAGQSGLVVQNFCWILYVEHAHFTAKLAKFRKVSQMKQI